MESVTPVLCSQFNTLDVNAVSQIFQNITSSNDLPKVINKPKGGDVYKLKVENRKGMFQMACTISRVLLNTPPE